MSLSVLYRCVLTAGRVQGSQASYISVLYNWVSPLSSAVFESTADRTSPRIERLSVKDFASANILSVSALRLLVPLPSCRYSLTVLQHWALTSHATR